MTQLAQQPAGGRGGGPAAAPATGPPPDVWFYKDPSGNEQGPFAAPKLLKWVEQGYFSNDLPVSLQHPSVMTGSNLHLLHDGSLGMGKPQRAWLV